MAKRFIKGKHGRSHRDYQPFVNGQDGTQERPLEEPVPKYFARPGDGIITSAGFEPGIDNNTMIIMGRDRSGEAEVDALKYRNKKSNSGYSQYMGAGAIDIVVGRVSPFPLNVEGASFGPLYVTKRNIPELDLETLDGTEAGQKFFTSHPGYAMDASRIYISQMTDIDDNFGIQKNLLSSATVKQMKRANVRVPTSGIMIKSDKIRMHSRQDIKIVTGGPGSNEEINSQGVDLTEVGGIHLIAGNKAESQQPIPLGDNLVTALEEVSKNISKLAGIVYSFNDDQMKYNKILSEHVHHSPFYGIMCTPSPTGLPMGLKTVLGQFVKVSEQLEFIKWNLKNNFPTRFLKPGAKDYINSKYNTTN